MSEETTERHLSPERDQRALCSTPKISILVINPNSTESMTSALRRLLSNLIHTRLSLDFFTAPSSAPQSIDDEATSVLSTSETFPALLPYLVPPSRNDQDIQDSQHHGYAAYLVACYSPHPLTDLIRAQTSAPVLNIFEASILHARAWRKRFGIVTTGTYWENVLADGVRQLLIGRSTSASDDLGLGAGIGDFVGVRSTGLNASDLHITPKEEVDRRIAQASAQLVQNGAEVIILGCAGMSGMEAAVREGARAQSKDVVILDGMRAGVVLLEGLVKAQQRSDIMSLGTSAD